MDEGMKKLTGEEIVTVSGHAYRLGKMVSCEARGVVYEDSSGEKRIKLYDSKGTKVLDEDRLDRLRFIQKAKKTPYSISVEDIIAEPYVGYVMKNLKDCKPLQAYLTPDKEMSLSEWYNRGPGLRQRLFIGYCIAKAFGSFEKRNLPYCDISSSRILVRKSQTGFSIRIVDTDNVYVAGKGAAAVFGSPRYMAPEVVSRQRNPDVLSDSYSLAVILFELLRGGHPYVSDDILAGSKREKAAWAGKYEYVTAGNSKKMMTEDLVLTDTLKKLFQKCFVDGKRNRLARPSAKEFVYALLEASNRLTECPHCGSWHYRRIKKQEYRCPWCDAPSKPKDWLFFFDILSKGTDYRNGKVINLTNGNWKMVNWYILRDDNSNHITSLYVLRADDPAKASRAEENYLWIPKGAAGYWAYNMYDKDGITIRKDKGTYEIITTDGATDRRTCQPRDYITLQHGEAIKLETDDLIFFDLHTTIEVGQVKYSFIRVARFLGEHHETI